MTPNAAILGPGGTWESSSGFMLPSSETEFLFFITHSFLLTFFFFFIKGFPEKHCTLPGDEQRIFLASYWIFYLFSDPSVSPRPVFEECYPSLSPSGDSSSPTKSWL